MKVCCVAPPPRSPSPALDGWQRALGADRKTFNALCGLAVSLSPLEEFPYDLVLVALSPESVSWLAPLRHLLEHRPGALVVACVDAALPGAARELEPYRRALTSAHLVIASQFSLAEEVSAKVGVRAVDVNPPWLETSPQAYALGPRARTGRPTLSVVTPRAASHWQLARELGVAAYAWLRLRYRITFHAPTEDARRVAESELVYLSEPLEDGGALAAHCAEQGALLLAPRRYDPARFCFPFSVFGPEPGRAGALALWLLSEPRTAAFFREHAAHRARQLSDGDRSLQLSRAIQQQFPRFRGGGAPSLLEQIRHVSGPQSFEYDEDECVVVCLVRNGGEHLPSFLEHYRALGVARFVFVDNGSDDGSRALLESQPDATVYEASLPHKHYENELRRLIIERHCQRRWCLSVDIDELFDFPGSEQLSLSELLRYLRLRGATALPSYLLDMFARENVFGAARAVDLKSEYPCYDVSDVEKVGYLAPEVAAFCDQNQLSDPEIGCYFGGIRKRVFGGSQRAQFLLTKHPLIFLDGVLQPSVHPHYSNRARVADVTGVLQHYKLTPSFKAKASESVRSGRYVEFAQRQYDEYHRQVSDRASLIIDTPGRTQLRSAWQLVDDGFLRVSASFRDYLAQSRAGAPRERRVTPVEEGASHA